MGWKHSYFPITRRGRTKKMPCEAADGNSLKAAGKHHADYYEVFDMICSELKKMTKGFQEVNSVFGFLEKQTFKNMKEK